MLALADDGVAEPPGSPASNAGEAVHEICASALPSITKSSTAQYQSLPPASELYTSLTLMFEFKATLTGIVAFTAPPEEKAVP